MLIFIIIVLFLILASVAIGTYREYWRKGLLLDRSPVSVTDIWHNYYEARDIDKQSFMEAWELICREAQVDPSRLRPTDPISLFFSRPLLNPFDKWANVADFVICLAADQDVVVDRSKLKIVADYVDVYLLVKERFRENQGKIKGQ